MTRKELIQKIGVESAAKLVELEKLAESKGLKVRVRTARPNEMVGDFCIFIYDKSKKPSYMVGFDGCFDGMYYDFNNCVEQSVEWIYQHY